VPEPTQRTVRAWVDRRAAETPDATYLIAPETGRRLSFGGLQAASRRLATYLAQRGAKPGERIALLMPNGYQTCRLFIGVMYGGYCVTPVNLLAQASQLAYVIEHCDARIVFVSPDQVERLNEAMKEVSRPLDVVVCDPDAEEFFDAAPASSLPPVAPENDALMMYTSGTTGKPKGVVLAHRAVIAGGEYVSQAHELTAGGSRHGGAAAVSHQRADRHRHRAAGAWRQPGAAAQVQRLDLLGDRGRAGLHLDQRGADHHRLPAQRRYAASQRASTSPACASAVRPRRRWRRPTIAPSRPSSASASSRPWALPKPRRPASRIRSIRRSARSAAPGRPSATRRRSSMPPGSTLPPGQTGEIMVRGDNVMTCYYKNPEETAKSLAADGWLHTGDLGHMDADGFVFVTGRLKELIIKGGENIAPREIDEALLKHPALLEAAAVGVPDEAYGQEIVACVVTQAGKDLQRRRAARILSRRAGQLQDAEGIPLRRRPAQGARRARCSGSGW
jgi:long-chain acyl-CoA synthetase